MLPSSDAAAAGTPGKAHARKKGARTGDDAGMGSPGVCSDAASSRVVWARVKGYPWWPVSVCVLGCERVRARGGKLLRGHLREHRASEKRAQGPAGLVRSLPRCLPGWLAACQRACERAS